MQNEISMIENKQNRLATPENEDFSGKYENQSFIAKYLVESYFKAVFKLISKIPENIDTAHEIGAGEGFSTNILKQAKFKLTASEYVSKNVELAKKRNPCISIFQEDIYELKASNSSYELVFLLEVLEHLDYPEKALKEINRVSKGYLILGVPNEPIWRILNMCRLKYLKDFGNTPGHLNHFSKSKLINIVESNFGDVIAVESPIPWNIVLAKKNCQ